MTTNSAPLHEQVLTAAAALDTTHAGLYAAGVNTIRVIVVGGAGVASGAVTLEGAHTPAYAGTWATIGAAVTAVADTVASGGANTTPFPYVRARISTVVAGGTVTVIIVGN